MNKKALLRSNTDLKRNCEDLQAKLQAEQDKTNAMQPNVDWKAECLRIHERKSFEIENLRDQTERLQVENQEQFMELRALKSAELKVITEAKLVDSVLPTARPTAEIVPKTAVANNGTLGIVTLFDMPPSHVMNDSSAEVASLRPAKTVGGRAFSDLASAMVFLICLLSALCIMSKY